MIELLDILLLVLDQLIDLVTRLGSGKDIAGAQPPPPSVDTLNSVGVDYLNLGSVIILG